MSETTCTPQQMQALYAALAAAQAEFTPIKKNRTAKIKTTKGYSYDIRYADLEEINNATRAALTKHGLALIQPIQTQAGEKNLDTFIDTMLVHKDGGTLVSRLAIRGAREFNDQKEFAAEVSYMRRYAVTAILNLAADDDAEQNGRGIGDDADPLAALQPEIRAKLDNLLQGLAGTNDDAGALKFWHDNKAGLTASKPAYDHFKEKTQEHRSVLRSMAKQGA